MSRKANIEKFRKIVEKARMAKQFSEPELLVQDEIATEVPVEIPTVSEEMMEVKEEAKPTKRSRKKKEQIAE